MPLKDYLIKKLSLSSNTPERIISTVVNFQFTEAFRATSNHNSIELSGLGKFVFLQKKAHKQMEKYLGQKDLYEGLLIRASNTEDENRKLQLKLNTVLKNIEHLKPKLNE